MKRNHRNSQKDPKTPLDNKATALFHISRLCEVNTFRPSFSRHIYSNCYTLPKGRIYYETFVHTLFFRLTYPRNIRARKTAHSVQILCAIFA